MSMQLPSSKPYQHKEFQRFTLGFWWWQTQGARFGVAVAVLKANPRASSQHVSFHPVLYGLVRQRHRADFSGCVHKSILILTILSHIGMMQFQSDFYSLISFLRSLFPLLSVKDRHSFASMLEKQETKRYLNSKHYRWLKGLSEFVQTSHHGLLSGQLLGSTICGSTVKSLLKWMTGRALKCVTHRHSAKISLQLN